MVGLWGGGAGERAPTLELILFSSRFSLIFFCATYPLPNTHPTPVDVVGGGGLKGRGGGGVGGGIYQGAHHSPLSYHQGLSGQENNPRPR